MHALLLGPRDPGVHTVLWNRTDDAARPVPRGVYLVVLQADGSRDVRKLVLTRGR